MRKLWSSRRSWVEGERGDISLVQSGVVPYQRDYLIYSVKCTVWCVFIDTTMRCMYVTLQRYF